MTDQLNADDRARTRPAGAAQTRRPGRAVSRTRATETAIMHDEDEPAPGQRRTPTEMAMTSTAAPPGRAATRCPYVLLLPAVLALARGPRLPAGPPGRALPPGVRPGPAVRPPARVGRPPELRASCSPTATSGRSSSARSPSASSTPPLTMPIGVGVALLMRQMSKPVRLLVQTGLLLAWAMPVLAALTVWQWLFDTQYGVINWLLTKLGRRLRGPLVADRAALVLLRRDRDRGLDERPVRRVHRLRRPHPGARGDDRGRRDRRRRRRRSGCGT